jgi:hypothetical protein
MSATNESEILNFPIKDLPVSENFCVRSKLMGYATIGEIVETPPDAIIKKEGFNYDWLAELIRLLMSYNMLHKLQPIPGSNAG